jgi:hypothetical protein
MRRYQIILACLLAGLSAGCVYKIRLKTIDADTHQPLEGVAVQWVQARNLMLQTIIHEGPTNLPPSGPNGIIALGGLHHWWTSEFVFTFPGYSNVYGEYQALAFGSGHLRLADAMQPISRGVLQDQFFLEGHVKEAVKTNGYFLIECRSEKTCMS